MGRSLSGPRSTCMPLGSSHRLDFDMRRTLVLLVVFFCITVRAQDAQLGRVEFPTSGSEKAQAHFLRGVAALHSFWYEEAFDEFREATKIEPDFAMGYWG